MALVVCELSDAWFELDAAGNCRLLAATTEPDVPMAFAVRVGDGLALRFRHVADLKGRSVYEAKWPRPGDDPGPSSPDPLLRLEGPFREGPRDVA